jgi:hypothetical protein
MRSMHSNQTKDKKGMSLNWEIEFVCIYANKDFLNIENQS